MTTTTNPAMSTSQMAESQIQYCVSHPSKKVKFYCMQDRDMFCSKCILKHTQQKHEVINCSPKGKSNIIDLAEICLHYAHFADYLRSELSAVCLPFYS